MRPEEVPDELVEKAKPYVSGMVQTQNEWGDALVRRIIAAVLPEIQAQALREAAAEMEAEYEERTAKSGAYGQMKIRAALRMGAGMVRNRADLLTAGAGEEHSG